MPDMPSFDIVTYNGYKSLKFGSAIVAFVDEKGKIFGFSPGVPSSEWKEGFGPFSEVDVPSLEELKRRLEKMWREHKNQA